MKKLMHIMVLSCYKATFLIEKSYAQPLSFLNKIQLGIHLKICSKCASYQKQSLLIEQVLKVNHHKISNLSNFKLSDATKLRIKNEIEKKP